MLNRILDIMVEIEEATGLRAAHYFAHKKTDRYIVWTEEGEAGSISADNQKQIQTIGGTVDFFTKTENDIAVSQIQGILQSSEDTAWRLNSIQYEDDTNYIHYEWLWEVVAGGRCENIAQR